MISDPVEQEPISTIDTLRLTYKHLARGWQALLADNDDRPATAWMDWDTGLGVPEGAQADARRSLLELGETSAIDEAKVALHNLTVLGLSYPHATVEQLDANTFPWPGLAVFSNARVALEGMCTAAWLLAPSADNTQRAARAGAFSLWSAQEEDWATGQQQTGQALAAQTAVVENAGLAVMGKTKVRTDTGDEFQYKHSNTIKAVLGERGQLLYRHWSGAAHAAPWKIKDWTHYDVAEDANGIHVSTLRFEDRHLELAADVAEVLPIAATAIGEYYGRIETTDKLRAVCTGVSEQIKEALPQLKTGLGRSDT